MKTSEEGKALVEKLENCDEVIVIEFTENYSESDPYWPEGFTSDYTSPSSFAFYRDGSEFNGMIFWNALGGLIMKDGTSVQSPAMSLTHEMGHMAQYIDGELENKSKEEIEDENLAKYETPIAQSLGEPTRASYSEGKQKSQMNGVTNFRTTINYNENVKKIVDHNFGENSSDVRNIY